MFFVSRFSELNINLDSTIKLQQKPYEFCSKNSDIFEAQNSNNKYKIEVRQAFIAIVRNYHEP